MHRPAHHRHRGFSLLEALVASAVLAVAVTAVTLPMTTAVGNELLETRQALATSLSHELMEEILAKPFYDPQGASQPGPESGESSRELFDNVDDYDGYAEPPGGIVAGNGETVAGVEAATLSRSVTAQYVYVAGQVEDGTPEFIRVEVTVKDGTRPLVTLTRLVYALP